MENKERDLLVVIASKVGLTLEGSRNGNGLLTEVEELQDYITDHKDNIKELENKITNIENNNKKIIEDLQYIKNELKDNINMRSFVNSKNLLGGIAQVITNLTVIGGALYFILKQFFERGQ